MKIVVDINHPAVVHYFKNFIWEMQKRGHEILVTASEKEVSYTLLERYGISYVKIGSYGKSVLEKIIKIPVLDLKMYLAVRKFQPDLFLGEGLRSAHVSRIMGKPCIALDDTEHAKWEHLLFVPFADTILTPSCYKKDFGRKQIRYNGYSELLYLHPKRFVPDPTVLTELGLKEDDLFIVVRFVSWDAGHDIGQYGIRNKVEFVKELGKIGRVIISSEGILPEELESNRVLISPEKLHDLLYYATLYVGEGATIASECAVLGTHAIYVNSLNLGYITEEDEKYHLVSDFSNRICSDENVLNEAKKLLQNPHLKEEGRRKGAILVQEKIDVTDFLIQFVENYPTYSKREEKNW